MRPGSILCNSVLARISTNMTCHDGGFMSANTAFGSDVDKLEQEIVGFESEADDLLEEYNKLAEAEEDGWELACAKINQSIIAQWVATYRAHAVAASARGEVLGKEGKLTPEANELVVELASISTENAETYEEILALHGQAVELYESAASPADVADEANDLEKQAKAKEAEGDENDTRIEEIIAELTDILESDTEDEE
jgi:hypothetical protein